jgi:hypothetical protein
MAICSTSGDVDEVAMKFRLLADHYTDQYLEAGTIVEMPLTLFLVLGWSHTIKKLGTQWSMLVLQSRGTILKDGHHRQLGMHIVGITGLCVALRSIGVLPRGMALRAGR